MYTQEGSDEDLVEAEASPVALRPTPSPSPPPDPLAGLPPYYPALQGCRLAASFILLNSMFRNFCQTKHSIELLLYL